MWRISIFSRYRSCVLLYKSAYYKVITYFAGNVFSIQYSVFLAVVTTLCIDSILYIYKYIYII